MTVDDLIRKLEKVDENLPVIINLGYAYYKLEDCLVFNFKGEHPKNLKGKHFILSAES